LEPPYLRYQEARSVMKDLTTTPSRALHPDDFVHTVPTATAPGRTVLERFPAGAPRGSWPAEKFAADRRAAGQPATVVMDLRTDSFLVVVNGGAR
jgi:hypothetical protein